MEKLRALRKETQRRQGIKRSELVREARKDRPIVSARAIHKTRISAAAKKRKWPAKKSQGQMPLRASWIQKITVATPLERLSVHLIIQSEMPIRP
jgi:hypothetical protein